jgi:hypothetical protein
MELKCVDIFGVLVKFKEKIPSLFKIGEKILG